MNPFDFPDLEQMEKLINSMNPDQKQKLQDLASSFLNNNPDFDPFEAAASFQSGFVPPEPMQAEEIEEVAGSEFGSFGLEDMQVSVLNGRILDLLDQADQLEDFLEEDEQADYSGAWISVLKALLFALRQLDETTKALFEQPEIHTFNEYAPRLSELSLNQPEGLSSQLALSLHKAHSDWISREEYEFYKDQLKESRLLAQIAETLIQVEITLQESEKQEV